MLSDGGRRTGSSGPYFSRLRKSEKRRILRLPATLSVVSFIQSYLLRSPAAPQTGGVSFSGDADGDLVGPLLQVVFPVANNAPSDAGIWRPLNATFSARHLCQGGWRYWTANRMQEF